MKKGIRRENSWQRNTKKPRPDHPWIKAQRREIAEQRGEETKSTSLPCVICGSPVPWAYSTSCIAAPEYCTACATRERRGRSLPGEKRMRNTRGGWARLDPPAAYLPDEATQ